MLVLLLAQDGMLVINERRLSNRACRPARKRLVAASFTPNTFCPLNGGVFTYAVVSAAYGNGRLP